MQAIHILLIDDHAMFRSGLRMVLSAGIPEAVIFEACALDQLPARASLDVVILDIKLPDSSGMEGIALIRQRWPQVPILMLSSLDAPETIQIALARGATGFISKAETAERIIEAIRAVVGEGYALQMTDTQAPPPKHLTQRQTQVLELLGGGLSNKLIARQLSLSENTVRRHVQDILEYFDVVNRSEAVYIARRQGLIH